MTLPLSDAFAFVADRNVFIDAYLVFTSKKGYKAEFQKSTTICCGFCYDEATTYGGIFIPLNSFTSLGMKNPRFSNRGFTLLYVVLVCLREHGPADRH